LLFVPDENGDSLYVNVDLLQQPGLENQSASSRAIKSTSLSLHSSSGPTKSSFISSLAEKIPECGSGADNSRYSTANRNKSEPVHANNGSNTRKNVATQACPSPRVDPTIHTTDLDDVSETSLSVDLATSAEEMLSDDSGIHTTTSPTLENRADDLKRFMGRHLQDLSVQENLPQITKKTDTDDQMMPQISRAASKLTTGKAAGASRKSVGHLISCFEDVARAGHPRDRFRHTDKPLANLSLNHM
jgi:hypothetical protein